MTVLTVDIGKTTTRIVAFQSGSPQVKRFPSCQLKNQSENAFLGRLHSAITALLQDSQYARDELTAIAVACPVPVNDRSPVVAPFRETTVDLTALDDLAPVSVYNDATAGVAGAYANAHPDTTDLLYVAIGTGIGGGIVGSGSLVTGSDGVGGEIGHISVSGCDLPCPGCDGRGHWEAACSGSQLPAFAEAANDVTVESAAELFARAEEDPAAQAVLDRMHAYNTEALTQLTNTLNPGKIVVSGGVAINNPHMVGEVRERFGQGCLAPTPDIALAEHGDLTNAHGLHALTAGSITL